MPKFFKTLWRVITFPFRLLFNIIAFPFRMTARFVRFLNADAVEVKMASIWQHVEEFRLHLLRAVGILFIVVIISFAFTQQIIDFLSIPIGGLDKLKAIEVTESISVFMRVAVLCGIAVTTPYIVFELWWFAAPGLKPREKKMGLLGIPLASLFFLAGMAFTYYVLLPAALPFLLNFMGIKAELRPYSYFEFVTGLMFWIGISFEFPLLIYVVTMLGFVQPSFLIEQWRIAIIGIAVLAAAITPTVDPVNMGLVMAPMTVLYFLGILFSKAAYAGRNQAQEKPKETGTTAGGA